MQIEQQDLWQKVMDLSRQLLDFARSDNWDEACCQEPVRNELLATFFSQPLDDSDRTLVVQDIKQIQEWDDETISLVKTARHKISDTLSDLRKGRRGLNAYQRNDK